MIDEERIVKVRVEVVKKSGRMVEFASEIDREYESEEEAFKDAEWLTSEEVFKYLRGKKNAK